MKLGPEWRCILCWLSLCSCGAGHCAGCMVPVRVSWQRRAYSKTSAHFQAACRRLQVPCFQVWYLPGTCCDSCNNGDATHPRLEPKNPAAAAAAVGPPTDVPTALLPGLAQAGAPQLLRQTALCVPPASQVLICPCLACVNPLLPQRITHMPGGPGPPPQPCEPRLSALSCAQPAGASLWPRTACAAQRWRSQRRRLHPLVLPEPAAKSSSARLCGSKPADRPCSPFIC